MKIKLLLLAITAFGLTIKAQTLVNDTAIVSGDTIFCNGGNFNKSALAFNPDEQMYYSNNAGGTQPNEYFDIDGNFLGSAALTDWRGLWYNTDSNAIEGNAWGGNILMDTLTSTGAYSGHEALSFVSNMPHAQSVGVFDEVDNVIYYYYADSLYSISRVDGTVLPTIALTGTSNLNSVVNYSIIYTGVAQNEIGLYSNTNKELYLFDKATGEYSSTIAFQATTLGTSSDWNYAFTNDIFWLYNGGINDWVGYKIFSECLTNQTTINPEICDGETYTSPLGINYTTAQTFNEVFTTSEGCDSVVTINLTVNVCSGIDDIAFKNLNVYPNPSNGIINLNITEELSTIKLFDLTGKMVKTFDPSNRQLNITEFTTGIYFLEVANAESKSVVKIIKK